MEILLNAGNDDNSTIIIKHNTGIFYTAQVDGMACSHPKCEGFLLNGFDFSDFNDCDYGCEHISRSEEMRIKLAKDLDTYLKDKTEYWGTKISFDFDNINELKEGWWPVILTGDYEENKNINWKGIAHNGNCD